MFFLFRSPPAFGFSLCPWIYRCAGIFCVVIFHCEVAKPLLFKIKVVLSSEQEKHVLSCSENFVMVYTLHMYFQAHMSERY